MNKILKKIFLANKLEYISVFAFTAFINILMLIPSWYMLQVYDLVLTTKDVNTLLGLSLIIVFLYFIYGVLERYRGVILIGVSESLDQKFLPVLQESFFQTNNLKNSSIINDLNNFKQFLTGQPILAFLDAPWFLIYIGTIYLLHPMLGMLALISTLVLFGLALINHLLSSSKLENSQKYMSAEKELIDNIYSASETLMVMGMKKGLLKQASYIRQMFLNNLTSASYTAVSLSAITKFSRILIQSAALGFAAYLAIDNQISAGSIIACSILLGRALSPIEGIINSWKQLGEFKSASKSIESILELVEFDEHTIQLGRPKGVFKLKEIQLRLRDIGRPTLDQISFDINAGETLAIIGPSGSGKTSLLKIMAGIYQPTNGQVLLDGSDIRHRNKTELGKYIGYLSQTTDLLLGKISTNIARFSEINSEKVLLAARLADAHSMIISLPEAYETKLGIFGTGLSEGQKRKIGLARALYDDPAILLLDEPGTGLDEVSIKNLLVSLKQLKQDKKTIVFTTHHPQFVELADKVVLLIDGNVKIFGSKEDVLKKLRSKNVNQ